MFVFALFILLLQTQAKDPDFIEGPANTYYVTCGDSQKPVSNTAESKKIAAPRTNRVAFARVRAETGPDSWCRNTSELFIADSASHEFQSVWRLRAGDLEGNGIKLIDWSPDGRYLLFDLAQWPYTHRWGNSVMVYDVDLKIASTLETSRVFRGEPQDCFREVRGIGFTPNSQVVIRATSIVDYEYGTDEVINPACPKYSRLWQLAIAGQESKRLPANFKPSKYGHPQ
jgi:hypothetical protein